jgi:hypothetical protein
MLFELALMEVEQVMSQISLHGMSSVPTTGQLPWSISVR